MHKEQLGPCSYVQISGIEAAAHAVRTFFQREDTEATLLVDADLSTHRRVRLYTP